MSNIASDCTVSDQLADGCRIFKELRSVVPIVMIKSVFVTIRKVLAPVSVTDTEPLLSIKLSATIITCTSLDVVIFINPLFMSRVASVTTIGVPEG